MVARTHSAPSSSFGMNSAPMRGISSSESASSIADANVVAQGRARHHRALAVDGSDGSRRRYCAAPAPRPHEPRAQHRQQRQRHDQRADQSEDHRVRHRLEEFAGGPGQDIDRQKARDDDRDRVDQRAVHFGCGVLDDRPWRRVASLAASPSGGKCFPPSRPRHRPGCRNPPRRSRADWPRRSAGPGK